ncbi:MAG TPA: hypothetical protein VM491_10405, partial [Burkholderiaceae bacterium]|nr:hypothetical protein [Burkholderiaceae bacterium]
MRQRRVSALELTRAYLGASSTITCFRSTCSEIRPWCCPRDSTIAACRLRCNWSARWQDETLLAVAQSVDRAIDGYRVPSG